MARYEVTIDLEAEDAADAMARVGWALYEAPAVADWNIQRSAPVPA